MSIGLGLVFLAGLVSFLSPCVISLVPAYLGALGFDSSRGRGQSSIILVGFFFFLGFTIVFLTLGFASTLIGNILYEIKPWIARIGGLIVLLFGLHLTGLISLPFLNYEWQINSKKEFQNKYINALLMGVFFSAGWSPCIGPILGSILTSLAAGNATVWQGLVYLLAYSLGLGLPFMLAATVAQPLIKRINLNKKGLHILQVVCGFVLCITGVLLALGIFSKLAQFSLKWII